MAALRILARADLPTILNPVRQRDRVTAKTCVLPVVAQIQCRWSSYKSSPIYKTSEDYTDYEITKDPNEWKYVERVLPYKTIPKPPTGDVKLPSGWKPACALPKDNSYFIERTKNYMRPVYLQRSYRGMKRITVIDKIQGDIWKLEQDVRDYVEEQIQKKIASQIHEFTGMIKIKGDYVSCVKRWMDIKGF